NGIMSRTTMPSSNRNLPTTPHSRMHTLFGIRRAKPRCQRSWRHDRNIDRTQAVVVCGQQTLHFELQTHGSREYILSIGRIHAEQTTMTQDHPTPGFFGDGVFEWQFPTKDKATRWNEWTYNEQRYWGDFPRDQPPSGDLFAQTPWAIGPFTKYAGNPVLAPSAGAWDCGHYDGGVHNGAILVRDNRFYYVYRGERPIDIKIDSEIDYICDIGLATSDDGIHFTKD